MSRGASRHHSPVEACQRLNLGQPLRRSPYWSMLTAATLAFVVTHPLPYRRQHTLPYSRMRTALSCRTTTTLIRPLENLVSPTTEIPHSLAGLPLEAAVPSSHWQKSEAATAPASCARIKAGTPVGRMPENVSVSDLATVTAGLAKLVDAVNQYAETI
jgi:hypothetical protein